MDWDAAHNGCCKALARTMHAEKLITERQVAITDAVCRIMETSIGDTWYGGKACYHRIEELEPTFQNEWDYEWPTDFPTS